MGSVQISLVYGFLGVLVAMALVTYLPKYCGASRAEGFEDKPGVQSCPEGSKSYYDKEGNLNCCTGTVNGTRCEGTPVCTFSGDLSKLPFCGTYKKKY